MVAVQVASVDKELSSDLGQNIWRSASGDRKGGGRRDGLAAGMTTMLRGTGKAMMMMHGVNGSASDVILCTCLVVFLFALYVVKV